MLETHTQKQQKNGENTKIDKSLMKKTDQQRATIQHDMHPGLKFIRQKLRNNDNE